MRVITGTARGMKLLSPAGSDVVRPTSDRVKESIFSSIQADILESRVVDLFAGSGQLGIEALSRGADFCLFIDNYGENQDIIKENLKKTKLYKKSKVVKMDALDFMKNTKDKYDFIFIDPPYKSDLLNEVLNYAYKALTNDGKIICETNKKYDILYDSQKLNLFKEYRYGNVKITVFVGAV
ncbi:MAG: 16S rRNA (guanine(966)-N(2))-methyltransferase RsmD [Oscillospiraceae bacterium]